ncbi:MAG: hypothetical protein O3A93_02610 [Chloroflexi bacterium]|nr:hypothetical protein [Chloroflexota bacterium]MDA1270140.1 hypothetical protein [Chloroflexota bacterium]
MVHFFTFILAHQGDAADPELVHWIKTKLDSLFGTGPWVVVALMGLVIIAIPLFIVAAYLLQGKRRSEEAATSGQVKPEKRVP